MIDFNGKVYKTCKIISSESEKFQCWTSENLNTNKYANGELIQTAKSDYEWNNFGENAIGAWCYYLNDRKNERFGKLYNWHAINNPRGLVINGWSIPSDDDWKSLEVLIGMNKTEVNKIGYRGNVGDLLKSNDGWDSENKNSLEFNAFPGGGRYFNGEFDHLGLGACWWSSSEVNKIDAWRRNILSVNNKINRNLADKGNGFHIRCIKKL